MKAIQITFDERLLAELDASEEVRREGRYAVLRRATAEYLARKQREEISEGYARAYANGKWLDEAFAGWEDQGQWPAS
jgi:metal-responsive CopG/Arc/MetJ family transcriptional regulator